jgi:hypothetical protein
MTMASGLLATLLFGVRTLTQNKATVPDQNVLEIDPSWATVTPDPANRRNILSGNGTSPTFGDVTASSLTLGGGAFVMSSEPSVTTTDDSAVNLLAAAIAIPASGALRARFTIEGKIASAALTIPYTYTMTVKYTRGGSGAPALDFGTVITDETNINGPPYSASEKAPDTLTISGAADNGSGLVRLTVNDTTGMSSSASVTAAGLVHTTEGNGVWAVTVVDGTHLDLRGSAFVHAYVGGGGSVKVHGAAGPVIVGNTLQFRATGIKPPAWIQGEAVLGGSLRYAAGAGNSYLCRTGGTTLGSGAGPTGTGTSINDNGVLWDYVGAGQLVSVVWGLELVGKFTS